MAYRNLTSLVVAWGVLILVFATAQQSRSAANAEFMVRSANTPVLAAVDGTKIYQIFDRRRRSVLVFSDEAHRLPLRDGSYRLRNGGAIRVEHGEIVWDAYGVIAKLRAGEINASVDPIG